MKRVEDERTEFKQKWSDTALKTVCAFANTLGGEVFVGVNDSDTIVGIAWTNNDEQQRAVSTACSMPGCRKNRAFRSILSTTTLCS